MPGLNASGPMGQGPLTGRRMGNCKSRKDDETTTVSEEQVPQFGMGIRRRLGFNSGNAQSQEFGQGRGLGRRKGQGRGMGRRGQM